MMIRIGRINSRQLQRKETLKPLKFSRYYKNLVTTKPPNFQISNNQLFPIIDPNRTNRSGKPASSRERISFENPKPQLKPASTPLPKKEKKPKKEITAITETLTGVPWTKLCCRGAADITRIERAIAKTSRRSCTPRLQVRGAEGCWGGWGGTTGNNEGLSTRS